MADNDWKSRLGMVYSTDPGFNYETDDEPEAETLPAGQQDLRVWLDRKQRAGKVVTLVKGCLLYTSPSPRDGLLSRMPSSA